MLKKNIVQLSFIERHIKQNVKNVIVLRKVDQNFLVK